MIFSKETANKIKHFLVNFDPGDTLLFTSVSNYTRYIIFSNVKVNNFFLKKDYTRSFMGFSAPVTKKLSVFKSKIVIFQGIRL